ncbi:MAG: alpha-glucuronidase family glycosyl hydrolase, partial [bacterium]
MSVEKHSKDYYCWLSYELIDDEEKLINYQEMTGEVFIPGDSAIIKSAEEELKRGLSGITGNLPEINKTENKDCTLLVMKAIEKYSSEYFTEDELETLSEEGYLIKSLTIDEKDLIIIGARTDNGILYGVFRFLNLLQMGEDISELDILSNPSNNLRFINHWDNLDGSIERGYAGKSIFYENNQLRDNLDRVKDYARLLASIGINSIAINNVNVHYEETRLISDKIDMVKTLAGIFRDYGIKTFLSVNYASPIQLSDIETADPLDEDVRQWWKEKVSEIYQIIPDFGGFLVKADSESRPGPFTYDRNHADGANMLAEALEPYGGIVIWRCFVYNCQQDWRDYETDRAR